MDDKINKSWFTFVAVIGLLLIFLIVFPKFSLRSVLAPRVAPTPKVNQPTPMPTPIPTQPQLGEVIIETPQSNNVVTSPLTVKGKIQNNWLFEGAFPITLLDASRKEIAKASAHENIPGSWQTEGLVSFTANLKFTTNSSSGFLVIHNDNPSGLPQNEKTFEIPVQFK